MKTACYLFCILLYTQISFAAEKQNLFRYDASQPLNIEEKSAEERGGVVVHDIRFNDVAGQSMSAYLITPKGKGPFASILYVHWLGDPETSNRTQFLKEAEEVAQHGAIALLIDMPWAVQGWFRNRSLRDDYDFSIRQVQNLKRAIDLLAQRSDVDRKRIAYVGHDFGATYGAILLGTDSRIRYAVLMAGTPVLSDWFLLGSQIQGEEREAYIKKMGPLDPVNFIGKAKPVPLLLQFATKDKFIPKDKAELFVSSAVEPKEFRWYEAEHELNAQAATERITWLETQLKLTTAPVGN
ncbi:MAG TPA: hypothetical protein VLK33_09895 [Terriglobales bacterium]|nr:hypothetical protein [Terriglobales bacterium]